MEKLKLEFIGAGFIAEFQVKARHTVRTTPTHERKPISGNIGQQVRTILRWTFQALAALA